MDFHSFKKKYQKDKVEHFPHQVGYQPVVSVMVQTYQHRDYIQTCLDSILQQETDFPFEILLGEDGSSDGTREICLDYAKRYPEKIRLLLHHPGNKIKVMGITTGNFNALYNFYSARGKYIAFCEGDDFWTDSEKLQKQVDHLKMNPGLSLSYHSFIEINERQDPLPKGRYLEQPEQDISKDDLRKLNFHPLLSTICFRNIIQDNIPEQMVEVINVDSFLLSLLGNFGGAGFLYDIKPSYYRRHGGGVWSGQRKELKFQLKIKTLDHLMDFYNSIKEYRIRGVFQQKRNSILKQLTFFYLTQGKIKMAIRSFPVKNNFS